MAKLYINNNPTITIHVVTQDDKRTVAVLASFGLCSGLDLSTGEHKIAYATFEVTPRLTHITKALWAKKLRVNIAAYWDALFELEDQVASLHWHEARQKK